MSKHCLHPNTQHPLVTRKQEHQVSLASSCRIARGCVARRRRCYRCARRHFLAFFSLAFFFAFLADAEPELDPELDPESESEPESEPEPEPDEDPEEEDPWLG